MRHIEPDSLSPAEMPPIGLPRPKLRGTVPIEACLQLRRSTRQFGSGLLSLAEVTQLLWAAQGVTGLGGLRTAPSAGAIYAIRLYLLACRVRGLPVGLYKYDADDHYIRFLKSGDLRPGLIETGLDRAAGNAAGIIILTADFRRPLREHGAHAHRLVYIEAGHIGQNICLESTALGLGAIGLGALDTAAAQSVLGIKAGEDLIYMVAIGKKLGEVAVV